LAGSSKSAAAEILSRAWPIAAAGCWSDSSDLRTSQNQISAGSVEYSVWQAAASLLLLFFL
jgi:hypothetical protein